MARYEIKVRKYSDSNRPHLKFVVNYREEGKRKRSFFETKAKAESFAELRNIQLENEGREGAEFPMWLRGMAQKAVEQLKPFGKTIADAVKHYVGHLEASEKSSTAQQLVDELLAAKKADGVSEVHLRDIRCRLRVFAEKFDGQMVATITSRDIDDWLRALPFSPFTRNRYRSLTVMAFEFAMLREYSTGNPAEKTAKAKESKPNIGILTVSETARLMEAAGPDILPYLAIGAFAGLRRAELQRLDWSEIDFESGLIEVTAKKAKTAMRRLVKMEPNLREWLLPVRKHKGSVTPEDFNDQFVQARAAAGIDEWPGNALRHSFASYHLAHFEDAAVTALQMGHRDSRITFDHYRELVKPKEAERYWNIKPSKAKKIVHMPSEKVVQYEKLKEYVRTHRHVKEAPNVGGKPGTWKTVRYSQPTSQSAR